AGADVVCLAVPGRALPAVLGEHGSRVPSRAHVLVTSRGLVPPLGTLPTAYVAERVTARSVGCLGGPAHARDAVAHGAAVVVACLDTAAARLLADALDGAGLDVQRTADVTGVELAGAAKNAA